MLLYLPTFSVMFLMLMFLYASLYCTSGENVLIPFIQLITR